MNVLIICEDFRKDQFIVQPIVRALMVNVGKPQAKVRVCLDPNLKGVDQALRWERIGEILEMYPMVQLFVLVVDRDGIASRRQQLDRLEKVASNVLSRAAAFVAENAWQEVEAWAIAGADLPQSWRWQQIRSEPQVKERFFQPLVERLGIRDGPGEGRKELGRLAAARIGRVKQRCDELRVLESRIASLWP